MPSKIRQIAPSLEADTDSSCVSFANYLSTCLHMILRRLPSLLPPKDPCSSLSATDLGCNYTSHYDGPDESKRRKEEARAKIKNIYYKHEGTFTFEKFVTSLYDAFQNLEKYGEPLYEEEKLRLLFSKSQNARPEYKPEIVICRSKCSTFASAVIYMKTAVARLFPDVIKQKSRRNVSFNKTSRELNGVDISDLSRWYDSSKIERLNETHAGRRVLAKIMGDKKRQQQHKDKIDRIKSGKRRKVKSVQVSSTEDSSTLSDRDRRMVATMVNGVSNASRHDGSINGRVIRTQTKKNDSASSESAVTFDYLGNPL